MQKIIVKYKSSYGNNRFYPECAVSKVILTLMNAKSFTVADLVVLKREFEVEALDCPEEIRCMYL